MKKIIVLFGIMTVGIFLLFPPVALSQTKSGGKLIVGVESDFKQFDPHRSSATLEGNCYSLMCETLVGADDNLRVKPLLAQSWDVSPDGLVWTFHLRKGVKFHNGRELTAEDVLWNFNRVQDPKNGAKVRSRLELAKKCEVIDTHTIQFTIAYPSSSFLNALWNPYSLTFYIIAKESINQDGKITHPIGTGPFKFMEWKPNNYTRFAKFEDYWDPGLPYLDEVLIKPIPDATIRLAALRSGDIDLARELKTDEVAKLLKDPSKTPDVQLQLKSGLGLTIMGWINNTKAPFDDVRVRQAIRYGIDKEEIELVATFGHGQVANQPFSKQSSWWVDVPEKKRNVAKAKALLKESGYPNGLEVTFTTTASYPEWVDTLTVMQDQLREIGMHVKTEIVDWPTMIKKLRTGEYQCAIGGISMYTDPEHLYRGYLAKGGSFNWIIGHYNNPKLTALLDQAARLVDNDKRKALYKQVVEIYDNDVPWVITNITPHAMGWRKYMKGYTGNQKMLTWIKGGLKYTWLER